MSDRRSSISEERLRPKALEGKERDLGNAVAEPQGPRSGLVL